MVYARLGDFAKAIADMDKALELSPDEPGIYENRADIYHGKGDYRRAISDYTDAIKIRRHRIKKYKGTYSMQGREWEFLMETIYSRAKTFLAMKSYDQAIDDLRFIENQIKAGPGKASLYRAFADIYRIKGDAKSADKYLRKAEAQESKINK
jgi:tetratricopeptide (TPR) repeat protein